jgi:OHCU decarboxylase
MPGAGPEAVTTLAGQRWTTLVAPTPMQPHARHVLGVRRPAAVSHLRLRAIPDGGVARLRAFGSITPDGWRELGVRHLDALFDAAAAEVLHTCCGAGAWVEQVVARRPFGTPAALFAAAAEVADSLGEADWREAFAVHPRIGERATGRSAGEQAAAATADPATLAALAEGNRTYEARFGNVFLIRAAGRSASEMLAALRERLSNDPVTELRVAADQQREITRLRLDALLRQGVVG